MILETITIIGTMVMNYDFDIFVNNQKVNASFFLGVSGRMVNCAADIYSFGMVALEVKLFLLIYFRFSFMWFYHRNFK